MGGVGGNDQMKSYYGINCRWKKWWLRIFFELLHRCIVNSHILERLSPNHNMRSSKNFRLEVSKLLIGEFSSRTHVVRPAIESPARFRDRHFPSILPSNSKGKTKERRCKVCSTKEKPKRTSYFCEDCDMGLCVAPCSKIFHTRQ